MEATISKAVLLKALQRVAGVAKGKAVMPVCSHVLLTAKEDSLSITATDLEIGIRVTCLEGVQVETPGQVAVPAVKFLDLVKQLPGDDVGLSLLENFRFEVVSGESISRLGGWDPMEFPKIKDEDRKDWLSCSVHAEDLQALIGPCLHCVSSDETKINICGVYLVIRDGVFFAVSTDGHRLAVAGRSFEGLPDSTPGLILPRRGAEEIMKLEPGFMGLHMGKNSLEVVQNGTFISVRLTDGEFPDFRAVVPTHYKDHCTVTRHGLLDALGRVRLLSFKNTVTLAIDKVAIFLSGANNADEGLDSVVCDRSGSKVTVKIDGRFLSEALASLGGSEVVIKYSDQPSALVLLPANFEKWDERLVVLMPMRL